MNMVSCLLPVSPNFQALRLYGVPAQPEASPVRRKESEEEEELEKEKKKNKLKDLNSPRRRFQMYRLSSAMTVQFFALSHSP